MKTIVKNKLGVCVTSLRHILSICDIIQLLTNEALDMM